MHAAWAGYTSRLRWLLSRAANHAATSSNGSTALMDAAYAGRISAVQELLAWGANKDHARSDGKLNINIFFHVAFITYFKLDHLLFFVTKGFTSLMLAARNGHTPVVVALCDAGTSLEMARAGVCVRIMS